MKAIKITPKGTVEQMIQNESFKDCDYEDVLDLVSIIVDNEITAVFVSNHFSNLLIKNKRIMPPEWIFSSIDIKEGEGVITLEEALNLWG